MKHVSEDYGQRCRFDAFCKAVIRNGARTYLRDMSRRQKHEIRFSSLSQTETDKLCKSDEYPRDSIVFTACGYFLYIKNEELAEEFDRLPELEQQILILHCVPAFSDGEIGRFVGLSRSAVQRHRTKYLKELRKRLERDENNA